MRRQPGRGERRRAARYDGLIPASPRASALARTSSAKKNTRPEIALRSALRGVGLTNYRIDVQDLPGRPDIVFRRAQVAVFCDGDFWHGRDLQARLAKLERGHNAPYWVEKIAGNVARDRRYDAELARDGWQVLRYWESCLARDAEVIASEVKAAVEQRTTGSESRRRSRKRRR